MTSFENARMLIGYARVSTDEQNLSLQRDALSKAGCKRIFTDTASGAPTKRPGLADALSHLRKGDSLVVWKLDRLGRSVKGLVDLVEEFETRQIHFRSLTDGIDTRGPAPVVHDRGPDGLRKRLRVGSSSTSWLVSHKWSVS